MGWYLSKNYFYRNRGSRICL